MLNKESLNNLAGDIWKGAIKLRGKFKPKDYAAAILPMIVIRRIECVLETKRREFARQLVKVAIEQQLPNLAADALQTELDTRFAYYSRNEVDLTNLTLTPEVLRDRIKLVEVSTINYHNTTHWTIHKILSVNRLQAEANFREYVNGFAPVVRQIIDKFDFRATIGKMVTANRLESVMDLVKNLDLRPSPALQPRNGLCL